MRWRSLYNFFRDPDVAIDLGTATARLYVIDRGVVAEEPTTGAARDASPLETRWPCIPSPVRGGVVCDVDAAAALLGRLVQRVHKWARAKSRVLVCAPSDASKRERVNLVEAVRRTGVSAIQVVPEPLASAIGAGLDITIPYSQMSVDIGDGITEVAVIRSRKLVMAKAVRRAGSDLRGALQDLVRKQKKLLLPAGEADRMIREHGALYESCPRSFFSATAYDNAARPVGLELSREEVFEAIAPVLREIVHVVSRAMESLPAESAVEVAESGISLCGGGACLRDMDRLIARETSTEVRLAANPTRATIRGAGEILTAVRQTELWETGWDSHGRTA